MVGFQSVHIWDRDAALCNLLAATFETSVVDEIIAECHNILAHPVLVLKVNNRGRVNVREMFEKTDVQASSTSLFILDERWKLVVVTNEDEGAGKSNRAHADGKSDL